MDARINWLLNGDVSIQYLTQRLLLDSSQEVWQPLQARIETEGYGARLLSCRNENGHWGRWFYQPKWTCTHYTLLEMKELGMPNHVLACREMVRRAFDECMLGNGGINFAKSMLQSDVAVDGMFLNYAAYYCPDEPRVEQLADFILDQVKADGGYSWNPDTAYSDAHTTICVLEGFAAYAQANFSKHAERIKQAQDRAVELLLSSLLWIAADQRYQKLSHPYRYRYDILRALEYLATNNISYNDKMSPALGWLANKQTPDGFWHLENIHPGNVHFNLEEKRMPSRFITLKALLVQKVYG